MRENNGVENVLKNGRFPVQSVAVRRKMFRTGVLKHKGIHSPMQSRAKKQLLDAREKKGAFRTHFKKTGPKFPSTLSPVFAVRLAGSLGTENSTLFLFRDQGFVAVVHMDSR